MVYTSKESIQYAIAKYFGYRRYIIVANVRWDRLRHAADLLIVNDRNYVTEIRIKTSVADFKYDKYRKHKDDNNVVRQLYIAVPEKIKSDLGNYDISERCGIITVDKQGYVSILRDAKVKYVKPISVYDKFKIAKLGALKIWQYIGDKYG